MGRVYQAYDADHGHRVALKLLDAHGPDVVGRFKSEFRTLQDVQHPNLVTLGELFEHLGYWFFTMELVTDASDFLRFVRLKTVTEEHEHLTAKVDALDPVTTRLVEVQPQPLPSMLSGPLFAASNPIAYDEGRLRAALKQLALGLHALHASGKVHRDVKPSNVLVDGTGRLVIVDFGIAGDAQDRPLQSGRVVLGTARYMAPEQATGATAGPAADWYAVGVMLYQVLTGRLPFRGNDLEVLQQKLQSDAVPPSATTSNVPVDLENLCMGLLCRDVGERLTGAQVFEQLSISSGSEEGVTLPSTGDVFVGRRAELELLITSAAASRKRGSAVLVQGESGVGKSALLRHARRAMTRLSPLSLILAGRCYERESVPFKAIDSVMESAAEYLRGRPSEAKAVLEEADRLFLSQAFSAFLHEGERLEPSEAPRPFESRERLFSVIRGLIKAITRERSVVLMVDDLQWADIDSLELLQEIMREPKLPMLLIAAARPLPAAESQALVDRLGHATRIDLQPLGGADAEQLATALLGLQNLTHQSAKRIADEANGHPLFVQELVHRAALRLQESLSLDDALRARVERLDLESRGLLDLVALAGSPISQRSLQLAAGLEANAMGKALHRLRVANLLRTGGPREGDEVDTYHDRVRSAVAAAVAPREALVLHRRLAEALTATDADPESLAMHCQLSGDTLLAAAHYALAAEQATSRFAFEHAARLFRQAIDLDSGTARQRHWSQREAETLAAAGLARRSADAFLAALAELPETEATPLQWRAAEQLIKAGRIDEGVKRLEQVLSAQKIAFAATPRAAIIGILWGELRLKLRGLKATVKPVDHIPREVLERLDIIWAATGALGAIEPAKGFVLNVRALLEVLDVGEPVRLCKCLAMAATKSAAGGTVTTRRTQELVAAARAMGEQTDDPSAMAYVQFAEGLSFAQAGAWKQGFALLDLSQQTMLQKVHITGWEIDVMSVYALRALFFLGRLNDVRAWAEKRLRAVEGRGDLFAATNLHVGFPNMVMWLFADQPEEARRVANDAMRLWSQRSFHLQHYFHLMAMTQADLYVGDVVGAYARSERTWLSLEKSWLLRISQFLRVHGRELKARGSLAYGATASVTVERRMLAKVEADIQALQREEPVWSQALAVLLQAQVAQRRGNAPQCLERLTYAASLFDQGEMALYAALARRWVGVVMGSAGKPLIDAADVFMKSEGIVNPERLALMMAPGMLRASR